MLLLVAINSKYVHTNLAVRYLYQLCKEIYPCQYVEFNINQPLHEVLYEILAREPEYVAISTYIWNREYVEKLTEGLKKARKDIKIILGGPEVSFDNLNDWPFADFIIKGEGEYPFLDFCKSIASKKEFFEKDYPPFDLEKLPFAYKDEHLDKNRIYYYETSRGCPFRCSYCLSSLEKSLRFAPLEKVFEELKYLFKNDISLIKFVDRTFNVNKERAIELIEFCKKHSQSTQVHFEIDPTLLDDDIIASFNSSKEGLFRLEVGLQSFNPKTLDEIDRTYNLEKIDKNLKKLTENKKCIIHLDLIAGLPYEDYNTFKSSLDKTILYFCDEVQLGFLKMLKGTKIRNEAQKFGYQFFKTPPYEVIMNDFIKFDEIYKLKQIEDAIDKIYNRQYLHNTLRYLFKKISPSSFFEDVIKRISPNLNTKWFLKEVFDLLKSEYIKDLFILKNLFRFDVLRRFSEEFLPDELVITPDERENIKKAVYSVNVELLGLKHPKEVFRKYRTCILEFDIERFIIDNDIEYGTFLYLFSDERTEKYKLG